MKNEKGMTLIEVVGVITIMSILFILIGSILVNSMKVNNYVTTDRGLQHEANYITERVRNEYLKLEDDPFTLMINNGEKRLYMNEENGEVISEGFKYYFCDEDKLCEGTQRELDRRETEFFRLKIKSDDNSSYMIETTFNKIR